MSTLRSSSRYKHFEVQHLISSRRQVQLLDVDASESCSVPGLPQTTDHSRWLSTILHLALIRWPTVILRARETATLRYWSDVLLLTLGSSKLCCKMMPGCVRISLEFAKTRRNWNILEPVIRTAPNMTMHCPKWFPESAEIAVMHRDPGLISRQEPEVSAPWILILKGPLNP